MNYIDKIKMNMVKPGFAGFAAEAKKLNTVAQSFNDLMQTEIEPRLCAIDAQMQKIFPCQYDGQVFNQDWRDNLPELKYLMV